MCGHRQYTMRGQYRLGLTTVASRGVQVLTYLSGFPETIPPIPPVVAAGFRSWGRGVRAPEPARGGQDPNRGQKAGEEGGQGRSVMKGLFPGVEREQVSRRSRDQ